MFTKTLPALCPAITEKGLNKNQHGMQGLLRFIPRQGKHDSNCAFAASGFIRRFGSVKDCKTLLTKRVWDKHDLMTPSTVENLSRALRGKAGTFLHAAFVDRPTLDEKLTGSIPEECAEDGPAEMHVFGLPGNRGESSCTRTR